jgi:metal-responsive CopG/Arc/MetJ family transcriptional regulator
MKRVSAMNDLTRGERLQIMLTKEELDALDNWRFARRMPSRAAAIRELLKRGLSAEGFAVADRRKSGDFGVTAAGPPHRDRGDGESQNPQE